MIRAPSQVLPEEDLCITSRKCYEARIEIVRFASVASFVRSNDLDRAGKHEKADLERHKSDRRRRLVRRLEREFSEVKSRAVAEFK